MMTEVEVAMPRFVAFGEALTDFVRRGENTWYSAAGGACWNVARVVATLGVPAAWGGAVSADFFGDDILRQSRAAGLDMRFAQQVGRDPLIAMVYQAHPPKYFFIGNDSADLAFDPEALPAGWQEHCELAHFGCISLIRPTLGERLFQIAGELKKHGVKISYDPNVRNLMGSDFPEVFERMLSLTDILKISDEDLSQIYPGTDPMKSIRRVRDLVPEATIVYTCGPQGITLYSPAAVLEQSAFKVDVVDTVGAGDACIGGFLASLLKEPERDPTCHLRYAAATAAAACVRSGAHAPSAIEVAALISAAESDRD